MTTTPIKPDAPFYTDEELDALYERDPVAATRLSREQHRLRRELEVRAADAGAAPPTADEVRAALEEVRRILARDGGDVELVGLEGRVVTVRLKGACTGCPRAPLDLKHVVEGLLRRRCPGVSAVRNLI